MASISTMQLVGMLLLFCIVLEFATTISALNCLPCDKSACKIPRGCTNDKTTWDECGCCRRCAKGLGEQCGGSSTQFGRCAQGLGCSETIFSQKIGICVPASEAAEVL